jgi:hypothetical protein
MVSTRKVGWREFKTNDAQRNQIDQNSWNLPNRYFDIARPHADEIQSGEYVKSIHHIILDSLTAINSDAIAVICPYEHRKSIYLT